MHLWVAIYVHKEFVECRQEEDVGRKALRELLVFRNTLSLKTTNWITSQASFRNRSHLPMCSYLGF